MSELQTTKFWTKRYAQLHHEFPTMSMQHKSMDLIDKFPPTSAVTNMLSPSYAYVLIMSGVFLLKAKKQTK